MQALKKNFPPGVDATIIYDPNVFIGKSIHEVIVTIFVAILLVVGVVFLFLQNWRDHHSGRRGPGFPGGGVHDPRGVPYLPQQPVPVSG